jgi:hypothetical protein
VRVGVSRERCRSQLCHLCTPVYHPSATPPTPPPRRCRHHYHLQLFEACLRAMASADQTYIRLNGAGMCSMVHKVLTDAGACCGARGGGREGC